MVKDVTISEPDFGYVDLLTKQLAIAPKQILAVARLLSADNTVPFIARYRKEATGNLDEVQILKIQEGIAYYRELEARRETILSSIEEQGKMTDDLRARILACATKTSLEDLYLPYKPKRRTRATIAREKGLEPLADLILAQGAIQPESAAAAFVDADKGVKTVEEALAGARDIAAEKISENADIRALIRQAFAQTGLLISEAIKTKTGEPTKFEQYYDFKEKLSDIPSHRYLAVRRGEREGVLRQHIEVDPSPLFERMRKIVQFNSESPMAGQIEQAIEDAYKRLISPSVEIDVSVEAKMKADRSAVEVFAGNLRNLLLAAPLGAKPVLGIDPGMRTGCKCVALDATGKFLDNTTFYIFQGDDQLQRARQDLVKMILKYNPRAIAIGNGTGGRETDAFVRDTLKLAKLAAVIVVQVNESGASVYSASEIAREEFPDLDLTVRGAISIGRRLQDPLAELVKIDPKSIGVGQYQHDVYQPLLQDKLEEVVISCVNHVGVELNTASAFLLSRVSGIGKATARNVIEHRNRNGAFRNRRQLLKVPGLGPRAFEQAAGFLRIRNSDHPLDASAVHPERYELVERMAADAGVAVKELVGNAALVDKIDYRRYLSGDVGEPTLRDIVNELKKPGRDPRDTFEAPCFDEAVTSMEDLKEGMKLEGIVTNVTAFGAFVDIGVHQDGLVHISELADRFIDNPSEVVKAGDRIKVTVLSIDLPRRRIALSARQNPGTTTAKRSNGGSPGPRPPRAPRPGFSSNPFADL